MRLLIQKLFLLFLVIGVKASFAVGLSSEVDLEIALEKRISPMVLRFDPNALIRINVTMKKISAPLPGTAIEVENFSGSSDGQGFSEAEIANTTVTIYTTKDPFPNFLKKEITDALAGMKATVKVSAMSDEAKSSLGAADQSETERNMELMKEFLENYGKQSRSLSIFLSVAIGLTLLIALAVGAGVAFSLQKRGSNEMSRLVENRLVPVLKELGGTEERGGNNKPTVLQATLTATPDTFKGAGGGGGGGSNGNGASDVTSLDVSAIEAILSDCYWCQYDTYAAWLWSVMLPNQRATIFESKKLDKEYLKLIQALPKDRFEDHLDPTYLNPPSLHLVSQEDLARWVEGFLPGFHLLSPMRQATLPISLKTRLACAAETIDEKTKVLPFPEKVSAKRKIKKVQKFNDPTFEDETTILHNPAMVREDMRPQLKSLVWLSLRPLEYRKMVLAQYSAEQLAEAWIGSPEVLARLMEALPEKKRLMLEGYLKTATLSKKSAVYLRLVESGWNDEIALSEMGDKKAA